VLTLESGSSFKALCKYCIPFFVAPFAVCALNRNNIIIKAKKGQDIMKNTQSKYTMYEHLYCKN
jgi:hypothetical protein